ncbi:MAG: hypothetical protein JXA99_07740 [Candidatus Lokiarchaeota archaeon]|nr:hypothetical protein [Candidatus Lokiarchaeota archaeon]
MNKINEIFNNVLEEIKPIQEDLIFFDNLIKKIKYLLDIKAKELDIKYLLIEPQGSTGIKQTQLKYDSDLDLFIGLDYSLFKHNYNGLSKNKRKQVIKKDLLMYCNKWIKKSFENQESFFNFKLSYAEHPYVQIDYKKEDILIKLDIVLYFEIDLDIIKKKGPITAVDRSPWHGRFIQNNLTLEQKDNVRLLKQFFKACHCYGDKSPVGRGGFIGYSSELLIYHFSNIIEVFKNFSKLPKFPLDYYKRRKEELAKIPHFQNDFLIIIDPIDKNRNVASSISKEAYEYCNHQVSEFLKNPNKSYFEIAEIPEFERNDSNSVINNLFIVEIKDIKKIKHYTEIRDKLFSLGEYIKIHGEKEFTHEPKFGEIIFEIYLEPNIDEYNIALFCAQPLISETYERKGPALNDNDHNRRFKEKNPNYYEKNGFLWVNSLRKHNFFLNFLKNIIEERIPDYLKIVNISQACDTKKNSGRRALFVLNHMVLPFSENFKKDKK